jgi:hypothetical protein
MNMRLGIVAAVLLAAIGCNEASTPGGPGVTSKPTVSGTTSTTSTVANRPVYGEADRTFQLSTPALSTRLKQGETKTVAVALSRGKNFDEDVALKMTDVPQGVTVEPSSPRILHGDKDCKVSIQAAEDAALGEFTINVVGHPAKGADATTTLKLTVVEK